MNVDIEALVKSLRVLYQEIYDSCLTPYKINPMVPSMMNPYWI